MPRKKKIMTEAEIPWKKQMMTKEQMDELDAKRLAKDTAKADAAAVAAKAEDDAKAKAAAKAEAEAAAKAKAEAAAAAAAAAAANAEAEAAAAAAAADAASKAVDVAKTAEPIKRLITQKKFSLNLGNLILALSFLPYSQFNQQGYVRKEIPDDINIRVFEFLHIFLQMLAPIHTSVTSLADLEAIFYSVFVAWLLKQKNSVDLVDWLENINNSTKGKDLSVINAKDIYKSLPKWRKTFPNESCPWECYPAWIFSQNITWEKMKLAMSNFSVYENGIYQIDNHQGTSFKWQCDFESLPLYYFEESQEKRQTKLERTFNFL